MGKVSCGIIRQGNKYFGAKRRDDKAMGGKWEFPGGKVEEDEFETECLHREFNENVSLYVYHNFKRLCLDRIESTHPLHQTVLIGEELPRTLGGGGTALLAFLPARVQTAVMRSEEGCTPQKLAEIREIIPDEAAEATAENACRLFRINDHC